jgi:hypothetical protein
MTRRTAGRKMARGKHRGNTLLGRRDAAGLGTRQPYGPAPQGAPAAFPACPSRVQTSEQEVANASSA